VPGSFVVLTKDRLALFVPPIDKDAVMWNGLPQALDLLRQTHDADIVETSDELSKYLERVLNPNATLFTFDGVKPPVTTPQHDQARLLLAIETARLTKTPFEIARLKEACQVSSEAHRAVMQGVGQGKFKSEYEIAAYFQYKCAFKGSRALAYESIGAPNTALLTKDSRSCSCLRTVLCHDALREQSATLRPEPWSTPLVGWYAVASSAASPDTAQPVGKWTTTLQTASLANVTRMR
jgi:hypothetical protein